MGTYRDNRFIKPGAVVCSTQMRRTTKGGAYVVIYLGRVLSANAEEETASVWWETEPEPVTVPFRLVQPSALAV